MAEAIVLVCDECGKPEATTIIIRVNGRNYVKDLCGTHLRSLLANTQAPRRGRKRSVAAVGKTAARKAPATRAASKKRTTTRRQARKRKSTQARKKAAA